MVAGQENDSGEVQTALHPAVRWALRAAAGVAPGPAARAAASLAVVLRWVEETEWPDIAWDLSEITGEGFPVELAFPLPYPDVEIRYTADVDGPESDRAARLATAERTLALLGSPPLPDEVRSAFGAMLADAELDWGVWLGARHGRAGDRFKLYVEAPRAGSKEAQCAVRQWLGLRPLLDTRSVILRGIGHELGSGRTELYFQMEGGGLAVEEVEALAARFDLGHRAGDLLGLLDEAYDTPNESPLSGPVWGCSVALPCPGGPAALALFTFVRSFFRSDARARASLLGMGASRGWDTNLYAALSAPVADRKNLRTSHGAVAFVVGPAGSPVVQIGLQPIEGADSME